jgi:hypothetical protein
MMCTGAYLEAWEPARRCVRRKPTNWKDIEKRAFQRKAKTEPVGRPSIMRSPKFGSEGARMVFSQYPGTASC